MTLLVPACEAGRAATVGEGKHLRFRVRSMGATREAQSPSVRDRSSTAARVEGRFDVACRLKENHWNGTVAPQLVVRRLFDTPESYEELRAHWPQACGARVRARGRPRRGASSPSSASTARNGHAGGSSLESETFRALLVREEPLALPQAA